jgi:hypothetical protein
LPTVPSQSLIAQSIAWRSVAGTRLLLVAIILLAAGCASTVPPKPAMAPLGVNGPFGYTEQPIFEDRTSITYTGPYRSVSASSPRSDMGLQREVDKTYDFAIWRAAQIGQAQGYGGFKIGNEQKDTDIQVTNRPVYSPGPIYPYGACCGPFYRRFGPWGYGPTWGGYGGPWGYNDGYYDAPREAHGRAVVRLAVVYSKVYNPDDAGEMSIAATLSQMQQKWGTPTY